MRQSCTWCLVLLAGLVDLGRALAAPDPAAVYAWFRGDAGTITNASGAVTNWQNQATSGGYTNRHLAGGVIIYLGGVMRDAQTGLARAFQTAAIALVMAAVVLLAVRPSRSKEGR